MIARATAVLLVCVVVTACGGGHARPAEFDAENDPCAYCRMVGSNGRFAAQIAAPGHDPVFFDDIGCLRDFLQRGDTIAASAVAFVVDHSTGAWIPAHAALYTMQPAVTTPMSSHLLAHASAATRDGDRDAANGAPVTVDALFKDLALPGGVR